MRTLARGDDYGVDLRAGNDRGVVAGVELRAGFLRQVARPRRIDVGNREEFDGRMFRCQPRAQAADSAGADDGDTQVLAFDGGFLPRVILAGAREEEDES